MKFINKKFTFKIIVFIGISLLLLLFVFCNKTTTRENMTTSELESLTNPSKGFCETYRGKSHELESHCNTLIEGRCKTMDCCVWTNASKCVAGGIHGPTYKTDQSGNTIDFDNYYYKNKCYGKCD